MSAAQVLKQARALRIVLWGDGGKLCYEAPAGRLTAELRQALVAHKVAILNLLAAERLARRHTVQCADCAHHIPSPPVHRASGGVWEMPGGCAEGRTSPDARPAIYPCTGWYCAGWTSRSLQLSASEKPSSALMKMRYSKTEVDPAMPESACARCSISTRQGGS
jgi:hypothetical protein